MDHRDRSFARLFCLYDRRFDRDANAPDSLLRWFGEVEDPRPGRKVRHRLSDMLALAILAVLCGADRWVEVATWGRGKIEWLRTFLPLPHGIPSHDTFGRVFGRLNPSATRGRSAPRNGGTI
jgi:hypothetical protein